MAGTAAGNRLTAAHSVAQRRLRARFAKQLLALWPSLDAAELDRAYGFWSLHLADLIRTEQAASAALAAEYFERFREAETGIPVIGAAPKPRAPDPVPYLVDKLHWAAVVVPKLHLKQGESVAQAMRWGLAAVTRAGGKAVNDTGRGTVHDSTDADERALGWRRDCGPKACYFCALLATRGAVYKSAKVAQFTASGGEYHDGCNCEPEAVYTRHYWRHVPDNPALDTADELWSQAKGSGKQRLKNFRRLYAEAAA